MVGITIQDFGGKLPRRSKRLLPPNYSQECVNAKLLSGEIRGLRAPTLLHTFSSPPAGGVKRAWRVRPTGDPNTDYWVASDKQEAELLKSPLVNDAFDRWYLFEPGQSPKVYTIADLAASTGPHDVAFTYPSTAPTLTPTVSSAADVRDVVYVYTYVTDWGEESAPSPAAVVSVDDAGSVAVSNFYTPTPTISGRAFASVRIYRSVTVGGQAGLFYVDEVAWGVTSYNDTLSDSIVSLNEQLSSLGYSNPVSGLYGARVHPSGALVAFKGREVYFSEPFRPHVWPDTYKIAVADEIVGIEVFEQNVGVFTKGSPVLLYGATPAQVGKLEFAFPEPCISYGSILAAPEGAYYASHQGLVLFTTVGPTNITREAISKEEWETQYAATPSAMSAARYGTQYVCVESPSTGFLIDTLEPRIAFTDFQFDSTLNIVSMDEDYLTGDIYVVANDSVYRWDDSNNEEVDYVWKSKQEVLPMPVNFGALIVHLEPRDTEHIPSGNLPRPPYPPEYVENDPSYIPIDKRTQVLVEVFLNDTRVFVGPVSDRQQVRLPSTRMGDAWEIRITGQCRVYSVAIAETGRGHGRQL